MSERAPYSRVYWSLIDDPKFATVYDVDKAFAWWVRLLLIADQAHPAPAHVPARCPRSVMAHLIEVGLIDQEGPGRYRVHGLMAERTRRQTGPRMDPSGTQVGPKRDPNGIGMQGHRLDETRLDETRPATRARDAADVYFELAGHWPSDKARRWIDSLVTAHGDEAVGKTLAACFADEPNLRTLLGRASDRLTEARRPKPRYGLQPGTAEYEMAQAMAAKE